MQKDMTQGTPWKHILMFSMPILGGMILQLLYGTVDGIVVGNFVGDTAFGAMNTSVSYSSVLLSIATGLSTGCGVVISQFYGAKKYQDMRSSIATMLYLMFGLGLVITILGFFTTDLVLRHLLGVPDEVIHYADTYMRIYFLGMIFQFIYNAQAAALRSVGDSGSTMKFLLISSAANIVFDLVFVALFNWGVAGAAIGTVLAQIISVVIGFWYIKKHHELLWLSKQELVFSAPMCKLILKLGVPVAVQTMISSMGVFAIQRLVARFGPSVMAGVAAGSNIEKYALMPNVAFSSGMATYAGQNAGAGEMKRVWKGYVSCLIMAFILCITMSMIIFFLAGSLVGIFGCSGEALEFGIEYLRFMACILFLMTMLFVSRGMLQGVGDVSITTVITFVTLAIRVIFAYSTADYFKESVIYICMGLDFAIGAAFYVVRLASGKWKKKVLTHVTSAPAQDAEA